MAENIITASIAAVDNHGPPTTAINSLNHNSALVEPYISNAHSPSRPRRKQKINREQNRELNSSSSVLEADKNIVQAAAMARAVANNSSAINQTYPSSLISSNKKNSVNHHPSAFNSNNSRAINDLNFHSGHSNFGQYFSHTLGGATPSTNAAAMVHPMSHQSNTGQDRLRNLNINDDSQPIHFPTFSSQPRDQAVPENPDVARITQSIFGHINNLIDQTEANPESLQRLLEGIQTASVPNLISDTEEIQRGAPTSNPPAGERQTPQAAREISIIQNDQVFSNFGDISADDEDEHVTSYLNRHTEEAQDDTPLHCPVTLSHNISTTSVELNDALEGNNMFSDQSQT